MRNTFCKIFIQHSLIILGLICFNLSTVLANGGKKDNTDNPIESGKKLSNYKKTKYKKDATRLALRLLSEDSDFSRMDAQVPEEMVNSIYEALVAVHQSDLQAAKTVTRIHKLHTFPNPSVDRFLVIYEREAEWAVPLRLGDDITDNDKINSLSEKYDLKIDSHVEWDDTHNSFNIRAKESMNIASVAKDFSTIENITLVDTMEPNGDGNDISVQQIKNGWQINYMIKFDGCISGCKKKRVWTFEVTNDGKINFKGESGDELPAWMR